MEDTSLLAPTDATSPADAIQYYKQQYETLEAELAEFQASSQELEAELEKDVEAAEIRERVLKEKAESLQFEVDEWKSKQRQSKAEAALSQANLEKEITTLRSENRILELRLRDIEVQNDDFERQARNTSGSLEDLESRLNVSIEREVMLEQEIKIGEQERESLRIETQRLRDELSDLRIEAEVMQDKLTRSIARPPLVAAEVIEPLTPVLHYGSPRSIASSPMINTPPGTKSLSTVDSVSETPTPPSPPFSETSNKAVETLSMQPPPRPSSHAPREEMSASIAKARTLLNNSRPLPRSRPNTNLAAIAQHPPPSTRESMLANPPHLRGLANSTSLSHIRSLTAQMQRLEQRVQSARSKLPAPSASPRASPNGAGHKQRIPSSVTMRMRKRPGSAVATSSTASHTEESLPEEASEATASTHVPKASSTGVSRLSFGRLSIRGKDPGELSSDAANLVRPQSRDSEALDSTRPTSRLERYERPASRTAGARPESRAGRTTPTGHYPQSSMAEQHGPPSAVGYFAGHHRGPSSVANVNLDDFSNTPLNLRKSRGPATMTPSRNRQSSGAFKDEQLDGGGSGIPTPTGLRRKSGPGFPHTAFKSGVGDRNSIGGRRIASVMPLSSRVGAIEDTKMITSPQRPSTAQRHSIARLSQPRSPIVRQRTEPVTRRKLSEVGESY